jgi:hypothetical protein
MRGRDELVRVQRCRNCNDIVLLAFSSGHEDDRRHEHDHGGKGPKWERERCKKLEPVEIGAHGLQIHCEQRWLHKEQERGQ